MVGWNGKGQDWKHWKWLLWTEGWDCGVAVITRHICGIKSQHCLTLHCKTLPGLPAVLAAFTYRARFWSSFVFYMLMHTSGG